MKTTQRITVLEIELSAKKSDAILLAAHIRDHETQIAALRVGLDHEDQLESLPGSEAILTVLRFIDGTLSPSEIVTRLQTAGRADDLRKVTVIPDYLVKARLVSRPSRGHYIDA